ncbi:MAG: glycosyltransferase [Planctomycetota bacterium]|nr:MAG: glycosyltransferase [Planctomycetota bacterium]
MKKLLFLISNLQGGGAERAAARLSLALQKHYQIYWIIRSHAPPVYPIGGEILSDPTFDLPLFPPSLRSLQNFWQLARKIHSLKRTLRPFLTLSFMRGSNLLNVLTGGPTLLSLRSYPTLYSLPLLRKPFNFFLLHLYRKANLVVPNSQATACFLKRYLPRHKIFPIPNFLFPPQLPPPTFLPPTPTLITMGRLDKLKGHIHLLRVWPYLKQAFPKLQLHFLGAPPAYKKIDVSSQLQKYAQNLPGAEDIHFLGFQSDPFPYLRQATIFAFPSLHEGFPNAILEALACALPVVSADCLSGPREILAPNTPVLKQTQEVEFAPYGILFPVPDGRFRPPQTPLTYAEKCLKDAILSLLRNPQQQKHYRQRALERAQHYHPHRILPLWLNALQRATRC